MVAHAGAARVPWQQARPQIARTRARCRAHVPVVAIRRELDRARQPAALARRVLPWQCRTRTRDWRRAKDHDSIGNVDSVRSWKVGRAWTFTLRDPYGVN